MTAAQALAALLWVASATPPYAAGGPRPLSIKLAFAGYSSDTAVAVGSGTTAVNHVDEAWISVERLRFRDTSRCDNPGGRPDVAGPVFVEVVGGRATGLPDKLALEARRYCRLEGAFHVAQPKGESVPAGMEGASIVVRGRRSDGVRFVIQSRRADNLDLRASIPRGFAIRETDTRLFLGIDVAAWLKGVELAAADVDQVGDKPIIRIDDRSNRELLRVFERNVLSGIALFRDEDGDGVLSARERAGDKQLARGHKPDAPVAPGQSR